MWSLHRPTGEWGLRDYGTAEWEGGSESCNHSTFKGRDRPDLNYSKLSTPAGWSNRDATTAAKSKCKKCGAKRIDQQIGSEKTPEEFVEKMVEVFRQVWRVLRDDGTLWLNLGDSYGGGKCGGEGVFASGRTDGRSGTGSNERTKLHRKSLKNRNLQSRLKSGNLVGIPWRIALALQNDGWILRQDIIWAKPSPMPESVRNRCTKSHEYLFLLTKKGSGYYYDGDAIREPYKPESLGRYDYSLDGTAPTARQGDGDVSRRKREAGVRSPNPAGRNKRGVWNIASESYEGAHFATFPQKLVEPCIKAGTSEKGCCTECGMPWKRVVEEKKLKRERPNDFVKRTGAEGTGNSCANSVAGVEVKTIGWEPGCKCDADVIPCVVLDPFVGSGTTNVVALGLGRRSWGIDLSADYLEKNAVPRIIGALGSRPELAHLTGKVPSSEMFGEEM